MPSLHTVAGVSDFVDNAQAEIEAADARIRAVAQGGPRISELRLERMRAVTHCRECGEEIGEARKKAIAHAIRCVICEEKNGK